MTNPLSQKLLRAVGAVLLAAAILAPAVLPTAGEISLPVSAATTAENTLDVSNPLLESTVEVNVRDFVSLLLAGDSTVSSAEADYLSTLSDTPLSYTNVVPHRYVSVEQDGSTIRVTAEPYAYTSNGGVHVTWYPSSEGRVGNRTLSLTPYGTDGTREGILTGVEDAAGLGLTVPYTCTVTVPASMAEHYLNLTYRYADGLSREQTKYESDLAAYNAYQEYLVAKDAYDRAYKLWQDYVDKKAKYDKDLIKYQAYEQAMITYRADKVAYENYATEKNNYDKKKAAYELALTEHTAAMEAYEAALSVYEKEQAQIARAAECLTVLESAFVSADHKQLYGTLMGDTVATVVNNKEELVSVGKCNAEDIDGADKATKTLQKILTEYKALKGVPARFAYYSQHYAEIRDAFGELYGRLRSLYNNSNVKTTLISRGRLERYIEFVSQLYVISTGLDDTVNRSSDWTIAGHYDPAQFDYLYYGYEDLLVDPAHRPPDRNNANPKGVTCPSEEPIQPTPPSPFTMTEPTEPVPVPCPVEPETVKKPTQPTFVKEPVAPAPVDNPGEKPVAPAYTALQQRLMAAQKNGMLTRRTAQRDVNLTLNATMQKNLVASRVEFYDFDGQTLLFSANPLEGEPVVYGGPAPTRPDTAKYTYSFAGWKDENGQPVRDLGVSEEEGRRFYASYTETLRQYTVTWSVEGAETVQTSPYGTPLSFDGTPQKADTAQYTYRFVGWRMRGESDYSVHLGTLTGDVTYEAVFEPILRRYTVTWIHDEDNVETAEWDYGTIPSPRKTPEKAADGRYVFAFAGWAPAPAAVIGNATYTAQYTALPILPPENPADEPQEPILTEETYTAIVPESGQQISRLLELAMKNGYSVSFFSKGGAMSLYLNEAAVSDLLAAGGSRIVLRAEGDHYLLRLLNATGEDISVTSPLTLRVLSATAYTKAYVIKNNNLSPVAYTYENGELTMRLKAGATLVLRNEYSVTLNPCENGSIVSDTECAPAGDTVTLSIAPTSGYQLDSIAVVGTISGMVYPVSDDLTFLMPDEPVIISASFSRKTYTVIFMVEGKVISTKTYFSGEALEIPADPTKDADGNTVYSFLGWSPAVIPSVTADATYVAQFRESIQGDGAEYIPPDTADRAYILYIEVAVILTILIGGPIVITRRVKRRRKQKQAAVIEEQLDSAQIQDSADQDQAK